ncbi:MAG: hypothetical protein IJB28_02160 [Bacteroidaceae bacterium]|nr:hypothetical protein [Bacteroidaceae bacterium]
MTTMELNAEIFRQLSYIADEKSYMDKVLAYIKKLVKQRESEDHAALSIAAEEPAPYYTKAEILAGFDEACKDIKLAREGKLEGRPIEELLNEL